MVSKGIIPERVQYRATGLFACNGLEMEERSIGLLL
jgi:hypothetical protein